MTALGHIYVTAHGEYTSTEWTGEKAQFGLRLPITEGDSEPAKGSIFTPVANGDVDLDSGTQAGTNGTLTRTWTSRLGPVGSVDNANAAMQADLGDDLWSFLNTIKAYFHTSFRWTHVKIAPVAVGGAYAAPSAIYQFTSPLVGTASGACMPPEVAIALSLRAPVIGRRGRGRIYLPGLSVNSLGSAGIVASTAQTPYLSAFATLITSLEDMPGTEEYGPTVAVMSAGSATAVRPSQIRCGNHFDVQRRRQHQVAEAYAVTAL